jgi:multidrug efflux pump
MIGVTLFGLFLTPLFYVVMRALGGSKPLRSAVRHDAPATVPHHLALQQPEAKA